MADIDPKYASPNIRWALLLNDHPGAEYSFREAPGADIGVPERWGGDEPHVIATITFPDASRLAPVEAAKAARAGLTVNRWSQGRSRQVELEPDSEEWERVCTIALGRALKRAGYPPNMDELRAVMLWRRRLAEVAAVTDGHAAVAPLPPGADERALAAAGHADEATSVIDADSHAEAPATPPVVAAADPRSAELAAVLEQDPGAAEYYDVAEGEVAADQLSLEQVVEQARQGMGRLPRDRQATVRDRLARFKIRPGSPATMTEGVIHLAVIMAVDAEFAAAAVLAGDADPADEPEFHDTNPEDDDVEAERDDDGTGYGG